MREGDYKKQGVGMRERGAGDWELSRDEGNDKITEECLDRKIG